MHEQISLGGCPVAGFRVDNPEEIGTGGVFRYEGLRLPGLDGPSNLVIVASSGKHLLDPDLPQDIENAVLIAVKQETDPAKLRAFSQTLLARYPAAGSVLLSRAVKLENDAAGVGVNGVGLSKPGFKFQPFKAFKALAKDAVKIGPLAFVPGAGAAAILAMGAVEAGHTKAGKKFGKDLAKNPVLKAVATAYTKGYQQANPAFFVKSLVLGTADDLLHGKNIGQALKHEWHNTAGYIVDKAKLASNVAGVPPQVTSALTAAGHLAEGKPLPKDLLAAAGAVVGAAVPGAEVALQQGAAYGNQLAKGMTGPVLAQVAAAKDALPPEVKHAFDSGLAIQMAHHLQAKGYAEAHALLPPTPGGSAGKVVMALKAPTHDLLTAALNDVKRSLPAHAAHLARHAAAALVGHPELAGLSSTDLARHLHVPEPIARTALASVSHEVPGAPLVHPHRLEAIVGRPPLPLPPGPGEPDPTAWTAYYSAQEQAAPTGPAYGPYPVSP